ncbi:O-fucosyltransferase 29-like protein [Tanacetum coccineum]|uniref:O-fucosyltransferase family protein n=1 Tax=Tanacetum coccineum TaxID=301880 RepID=A0ABQ5CTZ1_9ASTR
MGGGLDGFGASLLVGRHRVLCDSSHRFNYLRRRSSQNRGVLWLVTVLLRRVPEVEAALEVTNLESMFVRKQVSVLFKSFSFSFVWAFFQWFFAAGDDCGFASFPTFGLKLCPNVTSLFPPLLCRMICPYMVNISLLIGAIMSWGIMWPIIEAKKGSWYSADLSATSLHGIQGYRVFLAVATMLGDGLFHVVYMAIIMLSTVIKNKSKKDESSSDDDNKAVSFDEQRRNEYFLKDQISNWTALGGYVALAVISIVIVPRFIFPQLKCGWDGLQQGGIIAGLTACGVMMNIVSTTSDLMQDFKTGSLILSIWEKKNKKSAKEIAPAMPSGMICGDSLWGVPAAIMSMFGVKAPICMKFLASVNTKSGFGHGPVDIWKSKYSKFYYGCSERGPHYASPVHELLSNGYLLIGASGGLNQQRTGITDAVVVARILNATLVVPELDHYSFWKDDSDFANIFDVDWFISFLAKDIPIVKRVPDKYMRSLEKPPYTMRVPRKSEPQYYLDVVLPTLLRRHVVQLTKFDYRLASDLDEELQRLRCRVNYHAFRFAKPLQNLGQKLVIKMREMANRYIAVHLRFEPDMLAFSGCYYGGGDKERYELGEIRKRWTNLAETSPDGERKRGKCPLTPHEVGLMLRALGFMNDTYIYVASGEIYGGDETLQPLRELFPNFYTKEMLASEELEPFLPFSSRLAAIDYIVCDESDVFVTNNNGNMAKILAGRRSVWVSGRFVGVLFSKGRFNEGHGYFNYPYISSSQHLVDCVARLVGLRRYMGHKRTIRPNAKKLSSLFMNRDRMPWTIFSSKVKSAQRGFMGEPNEIKPGRGDFHEYPSACICKKPFNFSVPDNNKTHISTKDNLNPEPESGYGRNEEDQDVNSTYRIINNAGVMSRDNEASSSLEEKEDDDFLAD